MLFVRIWTDKSKHSEKGNHLGKCYTKEIRTLVCDFVYYVIRLQTHVRISNINCVGEQDGLRGNLATTNYAINIRLTILTIPNETEYLN